MDEVGELTTSLDMCTISVSDVYYGLFEVFSLFFLYLSLVMFTLILLTDVAFCMYHSMRTEKGG